MDDLKRRLLDTYQRGLPLAPRPYAAMAEALDATEAQVIAALEDLASEGVVSRVGAVFHPAAVGASTLAAMAVPPERLETVAELVNGYAEVNHNYERAHRFNLWFVVTAADAERVRAVLDDIAGRTGLDVLDLPMVEDYHLDLGFDLEWT